MAEASQVCHERKAEDNAVQHCLDNRNCRDERHTNWLTSDHQDNAANVLPSGAIPKVRCSQPSDIPFLEDDGNSESASTCMAGFTIHSTNTPPATGLGSEDYPSWSLPRLPNNLQSDVTSNSNQGAHTYSGTSSTVTKVDKSPPPASASSSETSEVALFEETSPALAESDDSAHPEERPPTPEASGHSAHNSPVPVVTGHQCLKTSVACEAHCGQNIFVPQQSGSPTENDCHTANDGLLQQYKKANQRFHFNETFLVKELREKCNQCMDLQTENDRLKQLLEECKAENSNLRQEKEDVERDREQLSHEFSDVVAMLEENNEMVRQLEEMYIAKSDECERLKEARGPHQPPPFLDADED